jgi:hypothetical protein
VDNFRRARTGVTFVISGDERHEPVFNENISVEGGVFVTQTKYLGPTCGLSWCDVNKQ